MSAPHSVSVLGASRSGTTVLGLLLARRGGIFLGEVEAVRRNWDRSCSCGVSGQHCPWWSATMASTDVDLSTDTPLSPVDHVAVHAAMVTARPDTTFVDSTKSPALVASLVAADETAAVVHVVRDPRGLAMSRHRGWRRRNDDGRPPTVAELIRASVAWTRANRAIRTAVPEAIRRRYEDLAEPSAIDSLAAELGLDPHRGGDDHAIAGNPIRSDADITLRLDLEWVERLPRWRQALAYVAAWPEIRRYGYPLWTRG